MNHLVLTSIDTVIRDHSAIYLDNIINTTISKKDAIYCIHGSRTYQIPEYVPMWCTQTILGPSNITPINFNQLIHMVCGPKRKMYRRLQNEPRVMSNIFAGKLTERPSQLKQYLEWFKHIMSTVRRYRIQHLLIIDDPTFIYLALFIYHMTINMGKQSMALSRLFNEVKVSIIHLEPDDSNSATCWKLAIDELQRIASIHPTWRQIQHLDITLIPKPVLISNAKKIQNILDSYILKILRILKDDQARIPEFIPLSIPIILEDAQTVISFTIVQEICKIIKCLTQQLVDMITNKNNQPIYMSRLSNKLKLHIAIDWYTIDCHNYPKGILPCSISKPELDTLQKNILTASMTFKTKTCGHGAFILIFKISDVIAYTATTSDITDVLPLLTPLL